MASPQETIKAKLDSGALRQDQPASTWFGRGDGQFCDGCNLPVGYPEVEVEVEFTDRRMLRFHQACFGLWQMETGPALS